MIKDWGISLIRGINGHILGGKLHYVEV